MPKEKLKTIYVCTQCGETSPRWLGRCPSCGAWNKMEEQAPAAPAPAAGPARKSTVLTPAAPATPRQAPRRGTHPAHRRTYPLFLSQNYCNREKYVVKCYGEDSLVP